MVFRFHYIHQTDKLKPLIIFSCSPPLNYDRLEINRRKKFVNINILNRLCSSSVWINDICMKRESLMGAMSPLQLLFNRKFLFGTEIKFIVSWPKEPSKLRDTTCGISSSVIRTQVVTCFLRTFTKVKSNSDHMI